MSKIDIDKFFRDQFHAHEKNSGGYSPEYWKNFEQLLDKGNKKRNRWGFSLNNLLFFMSSFVIVMLIPLLFLRSDTIMEPDGNTVINKMRTDNTSDIIKESSSVAVDSKANDVVCSENPVEDVNSTYATYTGITNFQKEIPKVELGKSKDSVRIKDDDFNLEIPIKKFQILIGPQLTIIYQPKNKKGKKLNDINSTSKKGKIHRSQVLMPDLYYNGF